MQWFLILISVALLAACGGGDGDVPDEHTCYVEGKAMPKEACR